MAEGILHKEVATLSADAKPFSKSLLKRYFKKTLE